MNFFEHQEQSRKKTIQLVVLMMVAVFAIIVCVYAAVLVAFKGRMFQEAAASGLPLAWFDPALFSGVAAAVLMLVAGGSAVKMAALRRGGDYVAQSLGGRPVHPDTPVPKEKMLVNVVEEMALASGIAVPAVYVLDKEKGMNAFAAGDDPTNAVVAVTSGLLDQLSRDELQGVVAHEFSHILNGDMRLNMRLIGMISGIMVLATIGRVVLRSAGSSRRSMSGSRGKNGGPILLLGLLLLIIGYVGVFVSRIIQSAVSRQREFLADASAVQFTRNPQGIAGALKKIGGFAKGSLVRAPLAQEASHLFFSRAVAGMFATHPPLTVRIQRLDPSFTGEFAAISETPAPLETEPHAPPAFADGFQATPSAPERLTEAVGTVDPARVKQSTLLLQAVPVPLRRELTDPLGASMVVLALLLSRNDQERALQASALSEALPEAQLTHLTALERIVKAVGPNLHLPLVDLATPMLRRMSPEQTGFFLKTVALVSETDGRLNFMEFAIGAIVAARLTTPSGGLGRRYAFKTIEPLMADAHTLIRKLALEGHRAPDLVQKAYAAAMDQLPGRAGRGDTTAVSDPAFSDVAKAISRLAAASPGVKKTVLDACAHCVLFDRAVSIEESEMLRAVAYALDLPLPPFV